MTERPTSAEVHSSTEFQQYALIMDEDEAYYYGEAEIIASRQREAVLRAATAVRAHIPTWAEWYAGYLQTRQWRARAEAAKARFGGRCALCNSSEGLEAHHRTYERVGNENADDLVPLCADCHRAHHLWKRGQLVPAQSEAPR